jgi:hypothetical protein
MRLGFRYFTGQTENGGFTTLWTTVTNPAKDEVNGHMPRWGRIQSAKLSYSDFEITECNVTFANPSDALVRSLLAVVVAEPTPLDQGLDYLSASLWVQDPRFGYDPHPIFFGLILNLAYSDGDNPSLSCTLHDFMRLQVLERDIQDYQNLTDQDVAQMLAVQLNRAANTGASDVLSYVKVDPAALQEKRTSTGVGAVRKWQARLLDGTAYDKLQMYASRLGFKISPITKVNSGGEVYSEISIVPTSGQYEKSSGTYRRGDGEVINFSASYDPPSAVLTRNVMAKRFDAINEIMMIERAKDCTTLTAKGMLQSKSGEDLPLGAIQGPIKLEDAQGHPITLAQYRLITGPSFAANIKDLGYVSQRNLQTYNERISYRKGLHVPGSVPGTIIQDGGGSLEPAPVMEENMAQSGSLFWRMTGKLQVRFNPFMTTTDYLDLAGWGVWDGVWAIKSFTHDLGANPTTSFDLTFGDAVRLSG